MNLADAQTLLLEKMREHGLVELAPRFRGHATNLDSFELA